MKNIFLIALFVLTSSSLYASNVIGMITNTATAKYNVGELKIQQVSIPVNLNVVETDEFVEFMKVDQEERPTPETTVDANTQYLPTEKYGFNDLAVIKVTDGDVNINASIRETVTVTLNSDNGDIETLVLTETTVNSGIFMATIGVNNETIITNNNLMNVRLGEYIRVTYTDNHTKSATAKIVYPEKLKILVSKKVNKSEASVGDYLKYEIKVTNNETFNVEGLNIVDLIPYGLKPKNETFKVNGIKFTPTISPDGKEISRYVPIFYPKSEINIEFIGQIGAGVIDGRIINKAYATNEPYFTSNVAEAATLIKKDFMEDKSLILGQVYECKFKNDKTGHGIGGVKLFFEDGTYVTTDSRGMYHVEGLDRGTHVVQVDKYTLPFGYKLGKIKDLKNKYQTAGESSSQFVEVDGAVLKTADFCLDKMDENELKKSIAKKERDSQKEVYQQGIPDLDYDLLKSVQKKREIIWPKENYTPSTTATTLYVSHRKGIEKTKVYVNGKEVSMYSYEGFESDTRLQYVIAKWKGVPVTGGDNEIKVEILRKDKVIKTLTRNVHVTMTVDNIEFIEEKSNLLADGVNSPVIAVRMTDKQGYPARPGVMGSFTLDAPHALKRSKKSSVKMMGETKNSSNEGRYQIETDGIAFIELKPTTKVEDVKLTFEINNKNEYIETKLIPNLREWIMVGFAEGTIGYNTLKGHQEFLDQSESDKYTKGRSAFFAKGKVKGEWLATIRYDSGRDPERARLFDELDPNAYYTVYNDQSIQGTEAPSREKLYVKLEKKDFKILFGDYKTELDATELAPYKRDLTGIKMEYETKNISSKNFIAETEQLFKRDEIRGDGTSGYYYLETSPVIENSEKIIIEVRDRYRQERIVETKELKRYADYDINYMNGSLFFNSPISSIDDNLNPVFIVATYEVKGTGEKKYVMGGRSSFRPNNKTVEVGTTYLYEDGDEVVKLMNAVDVTVNITDNLELKAEYARSSQEEAQEELTGDAKSATLEYSANEKSNFNAYAREQSKEFGLGQTTQSMNAKRKVGFDGKHALTENVDLDAKIYRDTNLETQTSIDVMEMKGTRTDDTWEYYLGYRSSKETEKLLNNQALIGGSKTFFDKKLKLLTSYEYSFDNSDSQIYPTKATIGSIVKINENADIFATYEFTEREDLSDMGKVGVRYNPWEGMVLENATTSEKNDEKTEVYGVVKGIQSYSFTKDIIGRVGYERGVDIINESNLDQPINIGQKDKKYDVYSIGLDVENEYIAGKIGTEYRNTAQEDKLNVNARFYTQKSENLAYGVSTIYSNIIGGSAEASDLTLSLSTAYRPEDTNIILLEKLEIVNQERVDAVAKKLINNMAFNYMYDKFLETSFQYGIKKTTDKIEEYDYNGITQFSGVDFDYYMDEGWLFGAQASGLYAHSANNYDFSYGVSIGHNVYKNTLIKIGYNAAGFNDNDFSLQNYYYEGPYLQFKTKFNQDSIKDVIRDIL